MKSWKPILITVAVIVVVIIIGAISVRNGLITRDEDVKNKWSQVNTQLQRRNDLIPNLVNTVKGYASHESTIFTDVANARSRLLAAQTPAAAEAASDAVSSALGRLLAIAENYPDLKASENFRGLQDELAGTENRIANERRRYNDAVNGFNSAIRRFPGSLFAGGLGFSVKENYVPQNIESMQTPPPVEF